LIPVVIKNGSNGMVWDRGLYGGNHRSVTSGRFINTWGDFDEPLLDLPNEKRSQLFDGRDEFFEGNVDGYVLRFGEEMSTGGL
tara:strand:+ start:261 stop:509 length:249 start_codon:yes stop_codon:yes gene_type:complete